MPCLTPFGLVLVCWALYVYKRSSKREEAFDHVTSASSSPQPMFRFFHAAALIKDTMVIVGGRSEEEDYSNSVSLYQINCNTWINAGKHLHGSGGYLQSKKNNVALF